MKFVVCCTLDQTIGFMKPDGVVTGHPFRAAKFDSEQEALAAAERLEWNGPYDFVSELKKDDDDSVCFCWYTCEDETVRAPSG
jgi:hypothetical protein